MQGTVDTPVKAHGTWLSNMFLASSVPCRARVDPKHGTVQGPMCCVLKHRHDKVQGPMCCVSRTIYVKNDRSLIKALLCLHYAQLELWAYGAHITSV